MFHHLFIDDYLLIHSTRCFSLAGVNAQGFKMSNSFEQQVATGDSPPPPDTNAIELFLTSDADTRANVLLSHPQVLGFVFLNDDSITKAFLPERVID